MGFRNRLLLLWVQTVHRVRNATGGGTGPRFDHVVGDVKTGRIGRVLCAVGAALAVLAIAAGWLLARSREQVRSLDAAARNYVAWIRAGDRRAGVELGAERRFARALGVLADSAQNDGANHIAGHAVRTTLAARLVAFNLDPSALRLDDASWRCDPATACTRRHARGLERALRRLDGALATRRAKLHLVGSALPLDGAEPPPLAQPVPIRDSVLIASWLGTSAWGRLLRSRPPHALDFPDGHHLALRAHAGSIWATTWTDSSPRRGPLRIAEVPPVECGREPPLSAERPAARCREVAITAMVATRGGRVAVKLLRTDVDFVSELLLVSADYGQSWRPEKPRAIR